VLGLVSDEEYGRNAAQLTLPPAEFEEQRRREQLQVPLFTKNRSECVLSEGAIHWTMSCIVRYTPFGRYPTITIESPCELEKCQLRWK
jgi:hypothetical protein